MPNIQQNIDQLLRSPIQRRQKRLHIATLTIAVAALVTLVFAGYWYHRTELTRIERDHVHYKQQLPLTRKQKNSLTALAQLVSDHRQVARQSVWADLKKYLGVYRIGDISRRQYRRAETFLLGMMKSGRS